ncbi:NYN domain-containing protein [Helicobacter muridarum]|uniref:NYN domain-containing protein n=1 Tax=Helicobacter muridarum TaxID=216 RepID=A0A099TYS6_9HELI|nr:NYN domain-containing protein [Helicobacter muridarum]TLE00223.1 NYN domain-containing protein [Helicobacter muridarum]STQ85712.1 nuclease [Helicobacter muridarum]
MDTVIFVDWENLRHEIKKIHRDQQYTSFNEVTMDYNNAYHVIALIHSFLLKEERLKKIFFYTAKPLEEKLLEKNKEEHNKKVAQITQFLDDIVRLPFVATRLGVSKFRGIDSHGHPIIIQKQVDMLIGLDIAHIVYNKLADRIMIFSKDIDLIPAMKCARTNGMTTILANLKNGFEINHSLIKHSDLLRSRSCDEIIEYVQSALHLQGKND